MWRATLHTNLEAVAEQRNQHHLTAQILEVGPNSFIDGNKDAKVHLCYNASNNPTA